MKTEIVHAIPGDIDEICGLFEKAIAFQKANNYQGWDRYDRDFLMADIGNGLLYKIMCGDEIVCFFCACFNDALIWRGREKDDALYLHRIVLNRDFAGIRIMPTILDWAAMTAMFHSRRYIRMDTWADNAKLINYYKEHGFIHIEDFTTGDTAELPVQHRNLHIALLEKDLYLNPTIHI